MVAFCSTVKKPHWFPILCWKSRLGVDLKIIISSIASQEKENKIKFGNDKYDKYDKSECAGLW